MPNVKVKKIVKKYAQTLRKNKYPFEGIYLFGSYAENRAKELSDIDVAVILRRLKGNWWKNKIELARLGLEVDSRIEPHVFTVSDFRLGLDPFVWEIKKKGIKIK